MCACVARGSAEALRLVNLQRCSVGTFGEVVDQIVYLLRRCQNLGASNHTPVHKQTQVDQTKVVGMKKEGECERQEKVMLLLSLASFLLVIIGYNKSIVLQQNMSSDRFGLDRIVSDRSFLGTTYHIQQQCRHRHTLLPYYRDICIRYQTGSNDLLLLPG